MMNEQEMDKLKRAAFEVLRDNDGCECQDWIDAQIGRAHV